SGPRVQPPSECQRLDIVRRVEKTLGLRDRRTPTLLDQPAAEKHVESPARLRRIDGQGIFVTIGEQQQRVRVNDVTPTPQAPFYFAITGGLDRDRIGKPPHMTVGGGSGENGIPGPATTALAATNVWRLFQISHDEPVSGGKTLGADNNMVTTVYLRLGCLSGSRWKARRASRLLPLGLPRRTGPGGAGRPCKRLLQSTRSRRPSTPHTR